MKDQEFNSKLTELLQKIEELPEDQQDRLRGLADETKKRHETIRETVKGLQENLDHLRLSVKYLVFDLEATRRENNYLRKLLESDGNGTNNNDTDANGAD